MNVTRRHRARVHRMDRRSRLRDGPEHAQRPVVVRHRRGDDALQAEARVCLGVAQGRVDAVGRGTRRTAVVEHDLLIRDRHLGLDEDRLVVPVRAPSRCGTGRSGPLASSSASRRASSRRCSPRAGPMPVRANSAIISRSRSAPVSLQLTSDRMSPLTSTGLRVFASRIVMRSSLSAPHRAASCGGSAPPPRESTSPPRRIHARRRR